MTRYRASTSTAQRRTNRARYWPKRARDGFAAIPFVAKIQFLTMDEVKERWPAKPSEPGETLNSVWVDRVRDRFELVYRSSVTIPASELSAEAQAWQSVRAQA